MDKIVELTRFATPETEAELLPWAERVSSGAIRHKAEIEVRRSIEERLEPQERRFLEWWPTEDGRSLALQGELPAAEGAIVTRALDRMAATLPAMPGEEDSFFLPQRRADALAALCSARLASDPDPDRATVVVHAAVDALASADRGSEVEGGGVIASETALRLACHGRLQVVVEDETGDPIHVGRTRRDPPAWMVRQLRYRDRECRFPGCGSRRFTQAHHIVWWERGGRTDLDNLILVCTFHHKLVHEYEWRVTRDADGMVRWFRPDGVRYRAGPGPPGETGDENALSMFATAIA